MRLGIHHYMDLSDRDIALRLQVCRDQCDFLRENGQKDRDRHLRQCVKRAQDEGCPDKATQILQLIQRERSRTRWRRLKGAMAGQRGQSVQRVQAEDESGTVVEFSDQSGIENAIWSNIHHRRFYLAEEAPICQPPLRDEFGYCAQTTAGRAVLAGTYEFPPQTDPATRELLEEVQRIREIIPADSVSTLITGSQWSEYWKKAREETSSSESGLHFGHQIASAHSPLLSHLHATRCSIALRRGFGFQRWTRGLSVMLEKIKGCSEVSKLRSMLLMEADFNAVNKMIYGYRMMGNVRKHDMMPDEIFSEKNRTADDGTLTKVLFFDVVRQSRRAAGISSVDADNCFDRVAHAVASLIFQAFGVSKSTSAAMLRTIQEMQFFLRTAFGDSKSAAGIRIEIKTQGYAKGTALPPPGGRW